MSIGRFLAGVGALIWEPRTEKYFILRRVDHKDFGAGAWECVTGRVDQGENFEQALHREVREEIGAQVQIEFLIATTHFYRGAPQPENELLGLIYGCTLVNPQELHAGEEHSECRWVNAEEAQAFLPEGHWLINVIRRAELMKAHLSPELRLIYRQEGFNIG
jgi:8-oxo-dGTP pyrophosphatase MutT (NUDIX family)